MPWKNKTGLAKAAVVLVTILSIATISCGVNWVLVLSTSSVSQNWVGYTLLVVGWIESLALAASIVGLFVVFVIWLGSKVRESTKGKSND